jgi:predicted aminopeptidase
VRSSSSAETALLALTLALGVTTPGCYTTHVIVGQLEIMAGREDIEDVLEDPTVTADHRRKLALVLEVRRFAIERLGLAETGSYQQLYDTGERPVAWNVSASDPDAFAPYQWSFPIVGRMPYIGYFDEDLARAEGERLRALGLDALVLPVPAYSTLGWFDDPFFSSMLRYDEETIVDIVIHEMAHATVFIDEDAEFNETLATFIGQEGAEAFFIARGGQDDPALVAAREGRRQKEIFNRELKTLKETLWRIFEASGDRDEKLRKKDAAIAAWRERFARDIRPQLTDGSYDYVLEDRVEFNNAFLMMFDRYHGELDLFMELYEHHGRDLPATIRTLRALAEEDDPRAALDQRVADVRRLLAAHPAVNVPTR